MYQLTSHHAPFVHYQCVCSRTFIHDELYYCIKCAKVLCRFCLNEEIDCFYCRSCLTLYQQSEAATFKNKCSRSIDCPICFNVLQIMNYIEVQMPIAPGKQPVKTRYNIFSCQYCQYNTIKMDLKYEDTIELQMKLLKYKGKYEKIPQQLVYDRVLELYKFNQEETVNNEKFYVRTKRKFVPYTVPNKAMKN